MAETPSTEFVAHTAILASLFPSTGDAPSERQDQEEAAINIFARFSRSAPPLQATFAGWSVLDSAAASLENTVFFLPYACALVWDEPNVGWADLRLV